LRKLIKIFSIEEDSLAHDLAELGKKFEHFKKAEDSLVDVDDITAQVIYLKPETASQEFIVEVIAEGNYIVEDDGEAHFTVGAPVRKLIKNFNIWKSSQTQEYNDGADITNNQELLKNLNIQILDVEERTGIGDLYDGHVKMEIFEKQAIEVFDVEVTEDESTECITDVFSSVNLDVEAVFNL